MCADAAQGARLNLEMILPGLPTGLPPRPAGLMPARFETLEGGELTVKLWLGRQAGRAGEVKAA